jgi:hypothetical protein
MAETKEMRRARNLRMREKMAKDPDYAAQVRARVKAAKDRYEAKLKSDTLEGAALRARRQAAQDKFKTGQIITTPRKPGRIVSMCEWNGW